MTNIQKFHLSLTVPTLGNNTATIDRLAKALRKKTDHWPICPVKSLWPFAKTIRQAEYDVTATLLIQDNNHTLINVEPKDTTTKLPERSLTEKAKEIPKDPWPDNGLAVALDIGSTHLQASLMDIKTHKELASTTALNPGTAIGPDILTRIHAASNETGLISQHLSLIETTRSMIDRMTNQIERKREDVKLLVAAGNTTMTHFFLGLDVQSICREPYIPVVNRIAPFFANDLGLGLAENAVAWCLPNVGSYFGGDLVSGIVAADLHQREDTAILVDVGTNAEVVVGNRHWLAACAGAAGPALESGVAKTGILAQVGAIEGVSIDHDSYEPILSVISNKDNPNPKPKGLCGSGLLQLMAQLYLSQLMDMRGKLKLIEHERIVETDEGLGYVVAFGKETQSGEPIIITEVEIDILLRSKAGMYTILRTVLLEVGLEFSDLSEFFVAGAFGNVIDPQTAITLGMLPDLDRDIFHSLGNSSLAGCKKVIAHPDSIEDVETVTDRLTYIELNVNQALMNRFSAARFIPHTDASRFPSVPTFMA